MFLASVLPHLVSRFRRICVIVQLPSFVEIVAQLKCYVNYLNGAMMLLMQDLVMTFWVFIRLFGESFKAGLM